MRGRSRKICSRCRTRSSARDMLYSSRHDVTEVPSAHESRGRVVDAACGTLIRMYTSQYKVTRESPHQLRVAVGSPTLRRFWRRQLLRRIRPCARIGMDECSLSNRVTVPGHPLTPTRARPRMRHGLHRTRAVRLARPSSASAKRISNRGWRRERDGRRWSGDSCRGVRDSTYGRRRVRGALMSESRPSGSA